MPVIIGTVARTMQSSFNSTSELWNKWDLKQTGWGGRYDDTSS